jgi:GNAT superfamily N-acetyltransferase
MSTLNLQPLQLSDFDTLLSHALVGHPGEDLVGPPTPLCCPVTTQADASARLAFHFAKQRVRFLNDPTVRYMKVVERSSAGENNEDIISIARWHYYPTGYDFARDIHWETHNDPALDSVPKGFNIPLHNHILTTRDVARSGWMTPDEPCWVLMHMVTHPAHRGKGAAGILIRWGMEQAERDGVPAYLEAGVMGKPIYERYGFVQVGELLEVDLKEGGGEGVFVICKMGYFPQDRIKGE